MKRIKKIFFFINIVFLVLLTSLSVDAASVKISGSGSPTGAVGFSRKSGSSTNYPLPTLLKGAGLKVSLVEMSENGPQWVSYYYLLRNDTTLTYDARAGHVSYFNGINKGGNNTVFGMIKKNGYDYGNSFVGKYVYNDPWFDNKARYGFTADVNNIKSKLSANNFESNTFYNFIAPLLLTFTSKVIFLTSSLIIISINFEAIPFFLCSICTQIYSSSILSYINE